MKTITRDGYAATAAHRAEHQIAPNAAQFQGTGLPTATATSTDAFGPVWRLRGKRATAEYDSAPPV